MLDAEQKNGLLAVLAWWREAGIGDALADQGVDWTGRPEAVPGGDFDWPETAAPVEARSVEARPERSRALPPGAGLRTPEPTGGVVPRAPLSRSEPPQASAGAAPRATVARREPQAVASAREAARSARTLDELEGLLANFDGCPLKATAKNLCFYRGAPQARVMVIGEAPGRDEDIAGKPFVGRAGQLLDRMLGAIGLGEADVHITNIVYWRPPGNRTPTPEEAQACRPFLERQIELVGPDVLLTLGGPAAKAILDTPDGILKLRGKWRELASGGRSIRVMPTLHPAYLLRQPEAKRQAWRDLVELKAAVSS